jgi:hypothetical protein
MRSLLNIITATCGVLALALAAGLLRPGLTPATLQSQAQRSVDRCMQQAGHGQDRRLPGALTTEQASSRDRALQRCWSDAANEPRFHPLGLTDPIAAERQLRDEGFRVWRCAERSGYVRTTGIPLSGPAGYPLQLAAGNFRVGSSKRDLVRFYRAAAKCSGESIEAYRWSNGRFSPESANGEHCMRHNRPRRVQQAGACYFAATYPDQKAVAQR